MQAEAKNSFSNNYKANYKNNNKYKLNVKNYNSNNNAQTPCYMKQKLNNIKCHHCGKLGHMKKDCYGYKKQINNENNKQVHSATTKPGFAFMLKSVHQNNNNLNVNLNLILESGATNHLINDESLFADYADLETPIKIVVAKHGEYIFATKRGVVRLEHEYQITLKDVLYCGKFQKI